MFTRSPNIHLVRLAITVAFWLPVAMACPLVWATTQHSEEFLYEVAQDLIKQGRDEEAMHELRKLLLLNPSHVAARQDLLMLEARDRLRRGAPIVREQETGKPPPLRRVARRRETSVDESLDRAETKRHEMEKALDRAASESRYVSPESDPAVDAGFEPKRRTDPPPQAERPVVIAKADELPARDIEPIQPEPIERQVPLMPRPAATWPPGSVGVTVDGAPIELNQSVDAPGGVPLVPVRDLAAGLHATVLDLGNGQLQIISPRGVQNVTARVVDGVPVMTPEEIEETFGVETTYDVARRVLDLRAPGRAKLQTFLVEKSPEELRQEAFAEEMYRRATTPIELPEDELPLAVRPDVDIAGRVAYNYSDPNTAAPQRSLVVSGSGRFYDYETRFETVREDIRGIFDHDYSYLNFIRPDRFIGLFDQITDLSPLRAQSDIYNGLKVRQVYGVASEHATSFLGGITDMSSGGVEFEGHMAQLDQEYLPAPWLKVRGSALYLGNEAIDPRLAGTTPFPRRNLVLMSGGEVTLPSDVVASAHLARATYEPDSEPDSLAGGWDSRVGLSWDRSPYRLGCVYEFVGPKYASVGDPAAYRDYSGLNTWGSYRVTDRWSVNSTLLVSRNNLADDPARIRTDSQALTLSSTYLFPRSRSLTLSYSNVMSDPSGPEPGSSSRSALYRADYIMPFLYGTRLLNSYQYFRSEATTASDRVVHTLGPSIFKSYGRGSSWYFSPQLVKTFEELEGDNVNLVTTLSVDHYLTRTSSIFLNAAYDRNATEGARGIDTSTLALGFRTMLRPETSLTLEYAVGPYDLDLDRGDWPREWSIGVFLSQAFTLRSQPNFGMVEGWVFEDRNANGRRDIDEPGVSDATIRLAARRTAVTDQAGRFLFPRAIPGSDRIELDLSSLDPAWTSPDSERAIDVEKRGPTEVLFPLIRASAVRGRVFIDANDDLVFQEATEEPLEGVAVVLLPDDQFRRTDEHGVYEFDYLLPGRYLIKVHPNDLPRGYEIASIEARDLDLAAGESADDIDFAVRRTPVPVKKFTGSLDDLRVPDARGAAVVDERGVDAGGAGD